MAQKNSVKYYVVTKKNYRHIPKRKIVTESEAEKAAKTGVYTYEVWPDNDAFHCLVEQEVDVFEEITTKTTIQLGGKKSPCKNCYSYAAGGCDGCTKV